MADVDDRRRRSPRSRRISANRRSTSSRGRLLVGSSISTIDARGRHRPADLDHLPRGDRQRADERDRARSSGCEKLLEQRARPRARIAARSSQPAARRLAAQQDVLGHRQVRAERQLLVDQRDAGAGARRAATPARTARRRPHRRPRRARSAPAMHVHQRALAGAVLADQRVDLARRELERRRRRAPRSRRSACEVPRGRARQASGYFRYSSTGGLSSACISGVFRFSGVTIVHAGVDHRRDLLALQVLHHGLAPRGSPSRTGSAARSRRHLALGASPSTNTWLGRSRRTSTLPAVPRSCSASSMPAVDDSLTQKMPCRSRIAVQQVLGRALGGVARRPGVLIGRDHGDAGELRLHAPRGSPARAPRCCAEPSW